jgi:hypothetical protein
MQDLAGVAAQEGPDQAAGMEGGKKRNSPKQFGDQTDGEHGGYSFRFAGKEKDLRLLSIGQEPQVLPFHLNRMGASHRVSVRKPGVSPAGYSLAGNMLS